jgi:hypothetical protein
MDSTGVRFLWANIRVGKFPGFYRRWGGNRHELWLLLLLRRLTCIVCISRDLPRD